MRGIKDEYRWLGFLKLLENQVGSNKEIARELIIEQKRKIRKITNKPIEEGSVFQNDYDGAIFKRPFPEYITAKDDAIEYFEEYERLYTYPSPYDCTGQLFTSWYKVFQKPNGEWWYYHCVSRAV